MAERRDSRTFVCRIDENDRITYVNPSWLSFALENDAPELTEKTIMYKPLWPFIADTETRYLVDALINTVRSTGKSITVPFNCDSPDCRRRMELTILPLNNTHIEFRSRIIEQKHRKPVDLFDRSRNRSDKILTSCSWCRKVYLKEKGWIEAEEAVKRLDLFGADRMPQITHGLCSTCLTKNWDVRALKINESKE